MSKKTDVLITLMEQTVNDHVEHLYISHSPSRELLQMEIRVDGKLTNRSEMRRQQDLRDYRNQIVRFSRDGYVILSSDQVDMFNL